MTVFQIEREVMEIFKKLYAIANAVQEAGALIMEI